MKNMRFILISSLLVLLIVTGCATDTEQAETDDSPVVNLYTSRHYETDDVLFEQFTEETGITVNIIKGESDELIERITREGEATEADLFFTADAGRLHRAKTSDLLQQVDSPVIEENIPANLRDQDNYWFGLTKRARAIVYAPDRVSPEELSTYEALTDPQWENRVLIRSSTNIYNQSLLASFIALNGRDAAKDWAKGMVANMAQEPQGGDRDQVRAIAAGIGDLAVINTYYFGNMLNSTDAEEVKIAEDLAMFFPNQDTTGTHINVSGLGVTKHANNKDEAIKLIEFLSGETAQRAFADTNYEYPVNPQVDASPLLASWGPFKEQDLNLTILGENNPEAVMIFNEVDWK